MAHGLIAPPAQYHNRRLWQWPALCGLGFLALLLGFIGFLHTAALHGQDVSPLDALYESMKLFVLHFTYEPRPLTWELNVARFLAPLVVSFTTIKAFFTVAIGHHLKIRHQWKQGHVVICGLGRKGLQLAKDYHERNEWVVVIEQDADNPALLRCDELGIPVFVGDAGDLAVLARARVHCARLLVAVSGDDGKNVEIALHSRELCSQPRGGAQSTLNCFLHVVDPQMRSLLQEHGVFPKLDEKFRAAMFDFYASCAARLFEAHPLDGKGEIAADSQTIARLIVVAFGQMGESVAVQAALVGKFANGKKLQVTIIDPRAAELRQSFSRRYPDFQRTCDVEFIEAAFESPQVAARIEQLRSEPDSRLTFAVCCDEDCRSLITALELKAMLHDREAIILARMSARSGLAALLCGNEPGTSPPADCDPASGVEGIHPFGMLETLSTPGVD